MKPLVSVVIPVYNCRKYIGRAIDSALSQTYENLEIIVVDDGSTDDTGTVAKGYGDRIRYLRKNNGGPAAARNFGIREARGDIIAFLDSDDLYLPEKVEKQVEALLSSDSTGLVTCNGYCIDENDRETGRFIQERYRNKKDLIDNLILKRGICTSCSTLLARKDALLEAGLFDETLTIGEDRNLWIAIVRRWDVAFPDGFLIRYRRRTDSISAVGNYEAAFKNNRLFLNGIFTQEPFKRRLILKAKAYGYHYFYAAWAYSVSGNRRRARGYILKSLLWYPFKMTSESRSGLLVKVVFGDRFFNLMR